MKKVLLFMAWLTFANVSMLQAQMVNLYNESSIGMGDSIDCKKHNIMHSTTLLSGCKNALL